MAVELRKQNVACISLWPGAVKTELIQDLVLDKIGEGEKVMFDLKKQTGLAMCYLLILKAISVSAVSLT